MAKEPQPAEKTTKPPTPTGKSPVAKTQAASADPEPSSAGGKVVRRDPPASAKVTSPLGQDTVANDRPDSRAAPVTGKSADPTEKAATLLGDFKLLKKLGQGGMGTVYRALWIAEDREVALKVLSKELAAKGNFIERFKREARAMKKLDHPNVLRCLHVDEAKGFHFLAMEIVDGGSIEGWLKKRGRFSVGDALHIVLKTAHALQHAHDKGIIHRDVKPDNILLSKDGVIKVADLGLAKDTDEDVALTKTGAGAGTPIFMAPEQARDAKHVDVRVDVYALGVMLYVMLTGQAPFQGNTLVELIAAKETGKFDPMRRHNDEVPTRLDLIVDKMIAKDSKARYASCRQVIDELEPLGLENEALSFLVDDEETKRGPSKAPARPVGKTAAPNKAAAKTPADKPEEVVQLGVWYWKMVTPDGATITKKLTTDQIRTLIKGGSVDQQAQISKTATSGFRGAATFSEFQGEFKARAAATKANAAGAKFRDKFKEIEDLDARRRRWGWLTRGAKNLGGRLLGLLWILLILGIVGAAGYLGYAYFIEP